MIHELFSKKVNLVSIHAHRGEAVFLCQEDCLGLFTLELPVSID